MRENITMTCLERGVSQVPIGKGFAFYGIHFSMCLSLNTDSESKHSCWKTDDHSKVHCCHRQAYSGFCTWELYK